MIDESTFEEIYRVQSGALFNIAYHNTRDRSLSEDIVQDVFVRLWQGRNRNSFVSSHHIKHWLIRVTLNCINDHWRSVLRHPVVPLTEINEPSVLQGYDDVIPLIDRLDFEEQRILQMYYLEGMTFEEISIVSNITEAAARKRLSRARRELRSRIAE